MKTIHQTVYYVLEHSRDTWRPVNAEVAASFDNALAILHGHDAARTSEPPQPDADTETEDDTEEQGAAS